MSGPDGKLLVDAGIAVSRPQMLASLAALGPEPITHLINTHWHFDHTNGNTWLNAAGAKIIIHTNTLKYLSQVQRVDDWDYNFLALPPSGIPAEVFSDQHNLKLNRATLALKYYGRAHTDSDISVTFLEANVKHVGDTFWNGAYPFVDYSTGGSLDGMIAACDANLAMVDRDTLNIAGHGKPVGKNVDLRDFYEMLAAVRDEVATLKRQAHASSKAVASRPTAPFDAKYGNFVIDAGFSPGWFTKMHSRTRLQIALGKPVRAIIGGFPAVYNRRQYILGLRIAAALALVLTPRPAGAAADDVSPIYKVRIPAGYRQWALIAPSHEAGSLDELRSILGNPIAMDAYRKNKLPFPDGTILAKLAWRCTTSPGLPNAFAPVSTTTIKIMVRDSGKYEATGGWGFGRFVDEVPVNRAQHGTCFGCHQALAQSHDNVFTQFAP